MTNTSEIWMRDLPKILEKIYKQANKPFPTRSELALVDLIEWLLRVPSKKSRTVHKSRELENKILTPFEIKNLADIERLTTLGADLKPYLGDLTRAIRNRTSKNNDFFFSDWGLLHFHLGADFENKKIRVSRSGRVLIARFESDNAYFIDIVNHGRGYSNVWGDISHLKILYKNWPQTFNNRIDRDITEDSITEISSSDYIKMRNAGINVPVIINKESFFAPGDGIANDGSQIESVEISLKIQRELKKAEADFKKEEPTNSAFLSIKNDFSVGFLVPEKNIYYCAYTPEDMSQTANFFKRILSEIPIARDKSYPDYITPKRIKL